MKRRLLSVVLALVLIASMAVPALAISDSGTIASQPWNYSTTLNSGGASGTVRYQGPDQLFVSINVYNWCSGHTDWVSKYNYDYDYGNAYTEVDNMVTIDGSAHACVPGYGYLTGKVGSQYVIANGRFT